MLRISWLKPVQNYIVFASVNRIELCHFNQPTKRPPLVGEISANFLHIEAATLSAGWIPTAAFSAL
jgi:hypothetical protein